MSQLMISGKTRRQRYQHLAEIGLSASSCAYRPYSDYPVGVSLLTVTGEVFTGSNTENSGLTLTVHGEMSALNRAITAGALELAHQRGIAHDKFVQAVAVMPPKSLTLAFPCGHCRQYLSEFGTGIHIVVFDEHRNVIWKPLSTLLPFAPDPRLLLKATRHPRALDLSRLAPDAAGAISRLPRRLSKKDTHEYLLDCARGAVVRAEARWSHRPEGAALLLYDGTIYTGGTLENVGYTASLHAEVSALAVATADGAFERARRDGVHRFDAIKAVARYSPGCPMSFPCGGCRQTYCDFGVRMQFIADKGDGTTHALTLARLLPHAFVPDTLEEATKK